MDVLQFAADFSMKNIDESINLFYIVITRFKLIFSVYKRKVPLERG